MKINKTYAVDPAKRNLAVRALREATCIVAVPVDADAVYVELTTPIYRPAAQRDDDTDALYDDDAPTWARLDAIASAFA